MNIDNLKCFILVAENLSFARTAEALYISQPAVTKQINALEKDHLSCLVPGKHPFSCKEASPLSFGLFYYKRNTNTSLEKFLKIFQQN